MVVKVRNICFNSDAEPILMRFTEDEFQKIKSSLFNGTPNDQIAFFNGDRIEKEMIETMLDDFARD